MEVARLAPHKTSKALKNENKLAVPVFVGNMSGPSLFGGAHEVKELYPPYSSFESGGLTVVGLQWYIPTTELWSPQSIWGCQVRDTTWRLSQVPECLVECHDCDYPSFRFAL